MTGKVVSIKPLNKMVSDVKPIGLSVDSRFTDRWYSTTTTKGMPMGLLLAITYNADNTFLSRIS